MSFVGKLFGADDSKKAASVQTAGAARAQDFIEKQTAKTERRLEPFRKTGLQAFKKLNKLVTDPMEQLSFVTDNPFFDFLKTEAKNVLFSNQAAKGKVGSGDTAKALQNSFLLLGNELVQQGIGNLQDLATRGQNAVTGAAAFGADSARSIADLVTGGANAQAAGIIGARNTTNQGISTLVDTALGIGTIMSLSDKRRKENINVIDTVEINGEYIPVSEFNYKGEDEGITRIGLMAQDLEKVMPEAVITTPSGRKFIDYGELTNGY